MAIINNKLTDSGDVVIIKTNVPIVGLIALTDFIDSVEGEDPGKYFYKEFRYTLDGFNYTDWIELTTQNLNAVDIHPSDTLLLEYRYTRLGTDEDESLSWNNTSVNGTTSTQKNEVYSKSIFQQYFDVNDTEVLNWAINVTEKLYKPGIVPQYMERGYQDSNAQDRDYIDFWRTVAHFFAFFVVLARKIELFNQDRASFMEYIKQKGLFVCEDDETMENITFFVNRFYDEIRKRGTIKIVEKVFGPETTEVITQEPNLTVEIDSVVYTLDTVNRVTNGDFEEQGTGWNVNDPDKFDFSGNNANVIN